MAQVRMSRRPSNARFTPPGAELLCRTRTAKSAAAGTWAWTPQSRRTTSTTSTSPTQSSK
jgi:hypothetical protein